KYLGHSGKSPGVAKKPRIARGDPPSMSAGTRARVEYAARLVAAAAQSCAARRRSNAERRPIDSGVHRAQKQGFDAVRGVRLRADHGVRRTRKQGFDAPALPRST